MKSRISSCNVGKYKYDIKMDKRDAKIETYIAFISFNTIIRIQKNKTVILAR